MIAHVYETARIVPEALSEGWLIDECHNCTTRPNFDLFDERMVGLLGLAILLLAVSVLLFWTVGFFSKSFKSAFPYVVAGFAASAVCLVLLTFFIHQLKWVFIWYLAITFVFLMTVTFLYEFFEWKNDRPNNLDRETLDLAMSDVRGKEPIRGVMASKVSLCGKCRRFWKKIGEPCPVCGV